MYLTHQRGMFLRTVAVETYLLAVEERRIPLLPTEKRIRFVEKLISAAALSASTKSSDKDSRRVSEDYRECVEKYLSSKRNVRDLWEKFDYAEAETDGRLSPTQVVSDVLEGRELSYGQRSTLESYVARAIDTAKAKRLRLPLILHAARSAVLESDIFQRITETETVTS